MRSLTRCVFILLTGVLLAGGGVQGAPMSREQIITEGEKTVEAQIAALKGRVPTDWIGAVMYAGIAEFAPLSSHVEGYRQAVLEMGAKSHWSLPARQKDAFHADDFCIGQTFLDVYEFNHDPAVLGPLKERTAALVDHLLATQQEQKLTWWWCDSLFMAPPALLRLGQVTGDARDVTAMEGEWWRVAKVLYDPAVHLFYRDERFTYGKILTKNGKRVFWARGNGWVAGGLARVLTYLPKSDPMREKYVQIFQEMMGRLVTLQAEDGTWPPSLLDAAEYPASEFSGTAFYCYAGAWGINAGLLDKSKYLPMVEKAWAALLAARRADGLPGYVQAVADAPGYVSRDGTQLYATGGFLMAAIELTKLAPIEVPAPPVLHDYPKPK